MNIPFPFYWQVKKRVTDWLAKRCQRQIIVGDEYLKGLEGVPPNALVYDGIRLLQAAGGVQLSRRQMRRVCAWLKTRTGRHPNWLPEILADEELKPFLEFCRGHQIELGPASVTAFAIWQFTGGNQQRAEVLDLSGVLEQYEASLTDEPEPPVMEIAVQANDVHLFSFFVDADLPAAEVVKQALARGQFPADLPTVYVPGKRVNLLIPVD